MTTGLERLRDKGPLTKVRVVGEVTQADGAEVSLEAGTEVGLVAGTEVDLATGAKVALVDAAGADLKTVDEKLRVSSMPYTYDITEGNVVNHEALCIKANVAGAGTSWTDMWGVAPATTTAPIINAAIAMELVSSSAQDAVGGTGLYEIEVHYLDTSGVEQSTTIQLAGATPVAMPENVLHVNTIHGITQGSGATAPYAAAGNIDIQTSGGGTVYARIRTGGTTTSRFVFRVPSNRTGFMTDFAIFVQALSNNSSARCRLVANQDPESGDILPQGMWITYYETGGGSGGVVSAHTPAIPQKFNAGAVIKCQAQRYTGSGNADCVITACGWLENGS